MSGTEVRQNLFAARQIQSFETPYYVKRVKAEVITELIAWELRVLFSQLYNCLTFKTYNHPLFCFPLLKRREKMKIAERKKLKKINTSTKKNEEGRKERRTKVRTKGSL